MDQLPRLLLILATLIWLLGLGGVDVEKVPPGFAYAMGTLAALLIVGAWKAFDD